MDALRKSRAKKIFIANVSNFPPGHCDGYDVDMYLSEMERILGKIPLDIIVVHNGTNVAEEIRVPVGVDSPQKIVDNFLSDTSHVGAGKFDSIPRNTFKHNAEKVLQTIKKLL